MSGDVSRCESNPCRVPALDPVAQRLARTRPIQPRSGSIVAQGRLRFGWHLREGQSDARLQICQDPSCASVLVDVAAIGSSMPPPVSLSPGTYYWRLYTFDAVGTQNSSALWHFTLIEDPPTDAEGFRPPEPDTLPPPAWPSLAARTACLCDDGRVNTAWRDPRAFAVGDVNGDGVAEALVVEAWHYFYCIGRNNRGIQGISTSLTNVGIDGGLVWSVTGPQCVPPGGGLNNFDTIQYEVLGVGDFDGDGYSDYVGHHVLWRSMRELRLGRYAGSNVLHDGPACPLSTLRSVGDVDGDQRPELFCGTGYASLINGQFVPLRVPDCTSVGAVSVRDGAAVEAIDANGDPFTDLRLPVTDEQGRPRWLVYEGGPVGLSPDRCSLRP